MDLFRSALTGFCRVLRLLRDFDWVNEPLIINFNQELTSNDKQENLFDCELLVFLEEQIFEMQAQFKAERASLPALCLIPSSTLYENTKPNVPILKRVIHLAKEALDYLEKSNSDSMKFLFRPSTTSYDAIIILDPLQCPRAYQAVDHVTTEVTYTTRKKSDDTDQGNKLLSIVDYDPPQLFLQELRVRIKFPLSSSIRLIFRQTLMIKPNFFTMNSVV